MMPVLAALPHFSRPEVGTRCGEAADGCGQLRKKLERDPAAPGLLLTMRGVG